MAKTKTFHLSDMEEIISYEHQLYNKAIVVIVAGGVTDDQGNFMMGENPETERYELIGQAYQDVLDRSFPVGDILHGEILKEELWPEIEKLRQQYMDNLNQRKNAKN